MQKMDVSYTSEQIDAGQFGAMCHPVTGEPLTLLTYDPEEHKFYKWVCGETGWGMQSCAPRRQYLPRIGDGRPRCAGKLFTHMHWKFDPFTGHSLEPRRSSGGLWEQG